MTGPSALFFSLFGQTQCAIDVPWKGSPALPFALFCNRNRCHWIARTNKILVLTLTEIVFEISRKMSLVVPWRNQSRGQISTSWNVLNPNSFNVFKICIIGIVRVLLRRRRRFWQSPRAQSKTKFFLGTSKLKVQYFANRNKK